MGVVPRGGLPWIQQKGLEKVGQSSVGIQPSCLAHAPLDFFGQILGRHGDSPTSDLS
jgi:hypothetical protein